MHQKFVFKFIIITVLTVMCVNCSGRINPLDILPGSEYHIGEYPNVHVHPSNPKMQPLSVQELDNAKKKLKNIR